VSTIAIRLMLNGYGIAYTVIGIDLRECTLYTVANAESVSNSKILQYKEFLTTSICYYIYILHITY
jgi:hypothetical protein